MVSAAERERYGAIPGALHAPYPELIDNIDEGGLIHELAVSGKTIVFYCAFGERSAMAVQAAQDKGLTTARHIQGGMAAWTRAGRDGVTRNAEASARSDLDMTSPLIGNFNAASRRAAAGATE